MPDEQKATPQLVASGINALKSIIDSVLSKSEDVGQDFPAEVRRIHYDEAPARPIHGQASMAEYNNLIEEGIDVYPVPDLKRDDLN